MNTNLHTSTFSCKKLSYVIFFLKLNCVIYISILLHPCFAKNSQVNNFKKLEKVISQKKMINLVRKRFNHEVQYQNNNELIVYLSSIIVDNVREIRFTSVQLLNLNNYLRVRSSLNKPLATNLLKIYYFYSKNQLSLQLFLELLTNQKLIESKVINFLIVKSFEIIFDNKKSLYEDKKIVLNKIFIKYKDSIALNSLSYFNIFTKNKFSSELYRQKINALPKDNVWRNFFYGHQLFANSNRKSFDYFEYSFFKIKNKINKIEPDDLRFFLLIFYIKSLRLNNNLKELASLVNKANFMNIKMSFPLNVYFYIETCLAKKVSIVINDGNCDELKKYRHIEIPLMRNLIKFTLNHNKQLKINSFSKKSLVYKTIQLN